MAKFQVPATGFDCTIFHSLPPLGTERTAMFRRMGEMTTGGDNFTVVAGGLAVCFAGGDFRKYPLTRKSQRPTRGLGVVVSAGNKGQICKRLHALLTGEIEVAADKPDQVAQPDHMKWQDEITARGGSSYITFWGERLPDPLQSVMVKDLGSYLIKVLTDILVARNGRSADRQNALRRLGEGLMPLALVLLVSHPDYKTKFGLYKQLFTSGDSEYRLPWDDYIERAIALIPSDLRGGANADKPENKAAQPAPDESSPVAEVGARAASDGWPPSLPPEFEGISVTGDHSPEEVLDAVRLLDPKSGRTMRRVVEKWFKKPSFALHAVFHIDRDPDRFALYKRRIRKHWDAWVETARGALSDG